MRRARLLQLFLRLRFRLGRFYIGSPIIGIIRLLRGLNQDLHAVRFRRMSRRRPAEAPSPGRSSERACGSSSGHTTWTSGACGRTVYGPPLNARWTALDGPATVRISNGRYSRSGTEWVRSQPPLSCERPTHSLDTSCLGGRVDFLWTRRRCRSRKHSLAFPFRTARLATVAQIGVWLLSASSCGRRGDVRADMLCNPTDVAADRLRAHVVRTHHLAVPLR